MAMSIRDERMEVDIPGRYSLADVVRMRTHAAGNTWRRCILCRHATKKLMCARCFECLDTENLDFFELDPVIEGDERYKAICELARG